MRRRRLHFVSFLFNLIRFDSIPLGLVLEGGVNNQVGLPGCGPPMAPWAGGFAITAPYLPAEAFISRACIVRSRRILAASRAGEAISGARFG